MTTFNKLCILLLPLLLFGCTYRQPLKLDVEIKNLYLEFLKNNDTGQVIDELKRLSPKLNFEQNVSDTMLHYFITILSISNRFDDLNLLLTNPNNHIEDNTRKDLLTKNKVAKYRYYNELDSLNYIVENKIKELDDNLKLNPKDTLSFQKKYIFYIEIYGLEMALKKLEKENSDNIYFNSEYLQDIKKSLINTYDTTNQYYWNEDNINYPKAESLIPKK